MEHVKILNLGRPLIFSGFRRDQSTDPVRMLPNGIQVVNITVVLR